VKPESEWRKGMTKPKLLAEMDAEISKIPGIEPSFSQPIRDNVLESISQIDGQIVIKVFGDDLEALRDQAEQVLLRYGIERLPSTPPERDRLEQDRVVCVPVGLRVPIRSPELVRATLAQERVVVQEARHLGGRTRAPMGAARQEQHEKRRRAGAGEPSY